ncbi:uncharacterized protein [Typha angustifolia]|uniref:uncharacterized protein n=1 Tax=Typha angustifolia TaxID=59011 RepID=UPI003C2E1F29
MSHLSSSTALLLILFLFFQIGFSLSSSSSTPASESQKTKLSIRKGLPTSTNEEKRSALISKILQKRPILETKTQTRPLKTKKTNSTTTITISSTTTKIKLPKLNKTLIEKSKPKNSTKFVKPAKFPKSNSTNSTKTQLKQSNFSTSNSTKTSKKTLLNATLPKPKQSKLSNQEQPSWLDVSDGQDLISEFRELPSRLHEALVPDLERLSTTSKAYISAANAGIVKGVKPYLGSKFAPIIAPIASALFLIMPLLLLTALVRRLGSYLSVLRLLLLFVQAYLAIYFATLALTALLTGLEPLKFFYATSPASYTWTQAVQSLGYVIYLVLQLVDLVFSSSASEGNRALGLAQMVVGLAVGLHYYASVFHRAVMGEAPRANWRVHGVYAACFLVICACARAERRKKTYVSIGGEEDGKQN